MTNEGTLFKNIKIGGYFSWLPINDRHQIVDECSPCWDIPTILFLQRHGAKTVFKKVSARKFEHISPKTFYITSVSTINQQVIKRTSKEYKASQNEKGDD